MAIFQNNIFLALLIAAFFYVLLKFNSWVINGFFQITRGEEKELADGKIVSIGKILYPIKKYFDRYDTSEVLFTGSNLRLILHHIVSSTPSLNNSILISLNDKTTITTASKKEWIKQKESVEKRFGVRMEFDGLDIKLFKVDKNYIVSDWIRKPVINCIHCMASVHSIYIFWPASIWLFGFNWWLFIVWPLYMLALVVFNIQTFKDSNI